MQDACTDTGSCLSSLTAGGKHCTGIHAFRTVQTEGHAARAPPCLPCFHAHYSVQGSPGFSVREGRCLRGFHAGSMHPASMPLHSCEFHEYTEHILRLEWHILRLSSIRRIHVLR